MLTEQEAANRIAGTVGLTLQTALNRLAGTTGRTKQEAMNIWAGTSGLTLQTAANRKAGTTELTVQECLNRLAVFSPTSVPGLQAWYDATESVFSDAGTTPITNGGTVQRWNDISGNLRHLSQATLTNKPTYNTGVQNGKPTITFDGNDNWMQTAGFTLDQPTHFFCVLKQESWNGALSDRLLDGVNPLSTVLFQTGLTPDLALYSGLTNNVNSEATLASYHVVDFLFSGAASVLRVDNGTPSSGNPGTNSSGGITLGADGSGALSGHVSFAEVLAYNQAPTAANVISINRYLGAKWGITVA